jgi:hypothetical protein
MAVVPQLPPPILLPIESIVMGPSVQPDGSISTQVAKPVVQSFGTVRALRRSSFCANRSAQIQIESQLNRVVVER